MDLTQLYYFNELVHAGNYADAARAFNITQPALNAAIQRLEAELGVPLFRRFGREARLTICGVEFSKHIAEGLSQIGQAVDVANAYAGSLAGTLNIGALSTVQSDYLPLLLNAYNELVSPATHFEIFQGFTIPLIEGLRRGEYDVVFAAHPSDDEGLECSQVVAHELIAAVNVNHPLAGRDSVTFDDLRPYHIYTYRRDTPIGDEVNSVLSANCINALQDYQDEMTVAGLICSNQKAVGVITLSAGLGSSRDLRILPIEGIPRDFHKIYMVTRAGEEKSPLLKSFVDFAGEFEPPERASSHTSTD